MTKVFSQSFERIIGISNDKLLSRVADTSFLKTMVSFDILFDKETKSFIAWIIEMFGRVLFLPKALMRSLKILFG